MKEILKLFAIAILAAAFSACDKEDDHGLEPGPDPVTEPVADPISQKIKQNISATVCYRDFGWDITISSKLADVFPGHTIVYGTECGYDAYTYYQNFNFKTSYLEKTDGRGNMNICFPVFVGYEYGDENLYYHSYKDLQNRMANGVSLDSDELDLWTAIVKLMNDKESAAKSKFCGRLYVLLDNTKYFYYTYGKIPY